MHGGHAIELMCFNCNAVVMDGILPSKHQNHLPRRSHISHHHYKQVYYCACKYIYSCKPFTILMLGARLQTCCMHNIQHQKYSTLGIFNPQDNMVCITRYSVENVSRLAFCIASLQSETMEASRTQKDQMLNFLMQDLCIKDGGIPSHEFLSPFIPKSCRRKFNLWYIK